MYLTVGKVVLCLHTAQPGRFIYMYAIFKHTHYVVVHHTHYCDNLTVFGYQRRTDKTML